MQDLSLGTRLSAVGLLPVTAALIVLGPGAGHRLLFDRGNTTLSDAAGDRAPRSPSAPSGCCRWP